MDLKRKEDIPQKATYDEKGRKESRLKGLYIQRTHLKEKLSVFTKRKEAIEKEIKFATDKLEGVQKGIDGLENREILLTSHFLERWQERVGINTEEEIKMKVLTRQFCNAVRTLSNGLFPYEEYTIVVQDQKLISIYKEQKHGK